MKSSLFHAVVVMGASLSACAEKQTPPAVPVAPPPSAKPSATEPPAATSQAHEADADADHQDVGETPAPAVRHGNVQTPDSVEPAKISTDPQPTPAGRKKKAAKPCPPHSESPYPPCWMIL